MTESKRSSSKYYPSISADENLLSVLSETKNVSGRQKKNINTEKSAGTHLRELGGTATGIYIEANAKSTARLESAVSDLKAATTSAFDALGDVISDRFLGTVADDTGIIERLEAMRKNIKSAPTLVQEVGGMFEAIDTALATLGGSNAGVPLGVTTDVLKLFAAPTRIEQKSAVYLIEGVRDLGRCDYYSDVKGVGGVDGSLNLETSNKLPFHIISIPNPNDPVHIWTCSTDSKNTLRVRYRAETKALLCFQEKDLCFDAHELYRHVFRDGVTSTAITLGGLRIPVSQEIALHISEWNDALEHLEREIEMRNLGRLERVRLLGVRMTPETLEEFEAMLTGSSTESKEKKRSTAHPVYVGFVRLFRAAQIIHDLHRGITAPARYLYNSVTRMWRYFWNHPALLRTFLLVTDAVRVVLCVILAGIFLPQASVSATVLRPLVQNALIRLVAYALRLVSTLSIGKRAIDLIGKIADGLSSLSKIPLIGPFLQTLFGWLVSVIRWIAKFAATPAFATAASAVLVGLVLGVPVTIVGVATTVALNASISSLLTGAPLMDALFKPMESVAIASRTALMVTHPEFKSLTQDGYLVDQVSTNPELSRDIVLAILSSLCDLTTTRGSRASRACNQITGTLSKILTMGFLVQSVYGFFIDVACLHQGVYTGSSCMSSFVPHVREYTPRVSYENQYF